MEEQMIEALRAAGYTEAQIAREADYLKRVDLENERIRADRAWNYGFVGPDEVLA